MAPGVTPRLADRDGVGHARQGTGPGELAAQDAGGRRDPGQYAGDDPGKSRPALFFSFNYPPHDGGVSRLCAELLAGLQRKGVRVQVLSEQWDEPGSCIPAAPEERVTRLRPWRELSAFGRLRRCVPHAVVICGLWYPEGLLATLAGAWPRVILAHGLELRPTRARWRRRFWRWLMQLVLRRASLVVANSRYTADLVGTFAPGASVATLPLGVDHRRFCPGDRQAARRRLNISEDKRVIVTTSRLHLYKGHSLVFQALAALPTEVRDSFVYLIAGQGRDMSRLQHDAEALGLERVVRWLGYVPEPDLPELYHSANLFVLCTREDAGEPDVEGFGLALLEAQACGIPVVGTRTGGIPEAVSEGWGGWLIHQDDSRALAAIFAGLVEAPDEFDRMGRIARQRVERECTWEHYMDLLAQLLRKRGVSICG
jgi:phosphatidylinositol alpha-1,6-mannosyltransferase